MQTLETSPLPAEGFALSLASQTSRGSWDEKLDYAGYDEFAYEDNAGIGGDFARLHGYGAARGRVRGDPLLE